MALVGAKEASYSSSSWKPSNYHVFLSFRGEDIRNTFLAHLYRALSSAGFSPFRDNDCIRRGENIGSEIEKAIREARSSIILFSKDYASSRWCLDELVMILRRRTLGHVILPVFYHVNPSQVRKQTGSFSEAFGRHEQQIKMKMDEREKEQLSKKVEGWRAALREVADLAGIVIAEGNDESNSIQEIVKEIGKIVNKKVLYVGPYIVGMESRVKDITSWLEDDSNDINILVIYGIGGVGKTTIAKYVYNVYNLNSERFETCSFLANVREKSKQPNGLVKLQKQLVSDISARENEKINSVDEGIIRIGDVISCRKVLVLIDDVEEEYDVEAIIAMHGCFHPKSKIILTTRRQDLLKANACYKMQEVQGLYDDESLKLFSWHAFGQDHPIEGYVDSSKEVVEYCGGIPLALGVLGSSLGTKSKGWERSWESTLQKLKAIPNADIQKCLKISYENLPDDSVKNIFLHIACFFIGKHAKRFAVRILDACGFYTQDGIKILINRSLLSIDEDKLTMHQLLRDMGREIVRQESPDELGQRSRLWHHEDSFKVLKDKIGTEKVKGLLFDMHLMEKEKCSDQNFHARNTKKKRFKADTFARMRNLALLHLNYVKINGKYKDFPKDLRWLCWHGFSLESLPSDFLVESLVVLDLRYSNLKQLQKGTKMFSSLKILNLSYCHDLANSPNFWQLPNLEELILKGCINLVELHKSIEKLKSLLLLNLKGCKNLRQLPMKIFQMKSLVELIISGCSGLEAFPLDLGNMESLRVFLADGINQSSSSGPESFCFSLVSLPRCLVTLNLSHCNLSSDRIPQNLVDMHMLRELFLSRNPICSLPELPMSLKLLFVDDCSSLEMLTNLPNYPSGLIFYAKGCKKLVEIQGLFKLAPVDLEMTKELSLDDLYSHVRFQQPAMINLLTDNLHYCEAPVLQGLYEYGIYSIYLRGSLIPDWIAKESGGKSYLSFAIPSSSPNIKIRGLKIFVVFESYNKPVGTNFRDYIVVNNETRNLMLSYSPTFKIHDVGDEDVTLLSNWKIEDKLMGPGDILNIWITSMKQWKVKELGIQIVHDNSPSICHQNILVDLLDNENGGAYLLHTGFTGMGWSRVDFPRLIVTGAEDEDCISDNVSSIVTVLEVQFMWICMEGLEAHFSQIPLIDMYAYKKRNEYRDLLAREFAKKLLMRMASFREGCIENLPTEFAEEWELQPLKHDNRVAEIARKVLSSYLPSNDLPTSYDPRIFHVISETSDAIPWYLSCFLPDLSDLSINTYLRFYLIRVSRDFKDFRRILRKSGNCIFHNISPIPTPTELRKKRKSRQILRTPTNLKAMWGLRKRRRIWILRTLTKEWEGWAEWELETNFAKEAFPIPRSQTYLCGFCGRVAMPSQISIIPSRADLFLCEFCGRVAIADKNWFLWEEWEVETDLRWILRNKWEIKLDLTRMRQILWNRWEESDLIGSDLSDLKPILQKRWEVERDLRPILRRMGLTDFAEDSDLIGSDLSDLIESDLSDLRWILQKRWEVETDLRRILRNRWEVEADLIGSDLIELYLSDLRPILRKRWEVETDLRRILWKTGLKDFAEDSDLIGLDLLIESDLLDLRRILRKRWEVETDLRRILQNGWEVESDLRRILRKRWKVEMDLRRILRKRGLTDINEDSYLMGSNLIKSGLLYFRQILWKLLGVKEEAKADLRQILIKADLIKSDLLDLRRILRKGSGVQEEAEADWRQILENWYKSGKGSGVQEEAEADLRQILENWYKSAEADWRQISENRWYKSENWYKSAKADLRQISENRWYKSAEADWREISEDWEYWRQILENRWRQISENQENRWRQISEKVNLDLRQILEYRWKVEADLNLRQILQVYFKEEAETDLRRILQNRWEVEADLRRRMSP